MWGNSQPENASRSTKTECNVKKRARFQKGRRSVRLRQGLVKQARGLPFLKPFIRVAAWASLILCALFPIAGRAQTTSVTEGQSRPEIRNQDNREPPCKIIYLGIVGGLETPNNPRSGVVQIRDILHGQDYPDVCAQSFSPYVWVSGLQWVLQHFPQHVGRLTKEELEGAPKLIIVGHSLGGWAALSVARNLKRSNIPVELTIQIDSVGVTDHTVPKNVKAAAIFHARDALMFLTTKKILLEDPSQTRLVENILVRGAGHESVTRDLRIRELVLGTVEMLRGNTAQENHNVMKSVL